MSEIMDDIAFLSQEVGPRPAGTEEEHQAALYLAEQFDRSAGLPAEVEDFACSSQPGLATAILFALPALFTIVGLFVDALALPTFFVTLVCAVLFVLELSGRPLLSRLFMRGASQNVVARFDPPTPAPAGRRRKVVVVANYDSDRVEPWLQGGFLGVYPLLMKASCAALVASPVLWLVRSFAGDNIVFTVLFVVLALLCLLPVVQFVMRRTSAYNEGANANASGTAALLELARRVQDGSWDAAFAGEGELEGDEFGEGFGAGGDGAADEFDVSDEEMAAIYGENYMEDAGLVPEGAQLVYEVEPNVPGEARGTGEADVAAAAPEPAATPGARAWGETAPEPATAAAPSAAAPAAREWEATAPEPADAQAVSFESPAAGGEAPAAEAAAMVAPAAVAAPEPAAPEPAAPAVPEWFANAQKKANRAGQKSAPAKRSRYADALDAAVAESSQYFKRANQAVEDQSAQRMEARSYGIVEVEAPDPAEFVGPADVATASAATPDPADMVPLAAEGAFGNPGAAAAAPASAPAKAPAAPAGHTTQMDPIDVNALREQLQAEADAQAALESLDPQAGTGADAAAGEAAQQAQRLQNAPSRAVEHAARIAGARVVYDEFGGQTELSAEEAAAAAPVPAVPQITLPEIDEEQQAALPTVEQLKQRAPLAEAAERTPEDDAKAGLSARIPRIDAAAGVPEMDNKRAALRATLPSLSGTISAVAPLPENNAVSLTGSFAAVGATGSFQPVGDELVADVPPEDLYIDDADDSGFDVNVTETGAYAGPGYMEMPKSRFGLFGRNKKKRGQEVSAQEWVGVDDDFNPTEVGRARGGWESFQEGSDYQRGGGYDNAFDDEDGGWNGGAFSRERAEVSFDDAAEPHRARRSAAVDSSFAEVAALAGLKEHVVPEDAVPLEAEERMVQEFRGNGVNVEVWFVALGSEHAANGGMNAFLAEHAADLRGAVVLNLESLAAGELAAIDEEGAVLTRKASGRVKRYLRAAGLATGRKVPTTRIDWRNSAASVALRSGLQAVTLAGMQDGKPALLAQGDDVLEQLSEETLLGNVEFAYNFIKNV